MSTQVNAGLATAEEIFKVLVWDTIVKAGLAALYAGSPLIAFFKPAINFIANWIGDWVYSQIRLVVDLTVIQLIDNQANEAFKKASVALAVIAHDKGTESDDYKTAREDAKEALSKFVRFNT